MMTVTDLKRTACLLPGIGFPVSIYYLITSKEVRGAAIKGLLLLPLSAILLSISGIIAVPGVLQWLANAYLYWGVLAIAGGWGFLVPLVIYRILRGKAYRIYTRKKPLPRFLWKPKATEEQLQ